MTSASSSAWIYGVVTANRTESWFRIWKIVSAGFRIWAIAAVVWWVGFVALMMIYPSLHLEGVFTLGLEYRDFLNWVMAPPLYVCGFYYVGRHLLRWFINAVNSGGDPITDPEQLGLAKRVFKAVMAEEWDRAADRAKETMSKEEWDKFFGEDGKFVKKDKRTSNS